MVHGFVWRMTSRRTKISPKSWRGLSHVTPKIFGIRSNISPKLHELETSNLVHGFVWRMTSRRTKISPESGRGLGDVTPTIFGSTVGYPSDSLASCLLSLVGHLSLSRAISILIAHAHATARDIQQHTQRLILLVCADNYGV